MAVNIEQSLFMKLADFLVSQPSLEQIANYKASPIINQRTDELLEKNRNQGLTSEERKEMENILTVSHLMTLAKAKARLKVVGEELSS
jgi:hypothetical protein